MVVRCGRSGQAPQVSEGEVNHLHVPLLQQMSGDGRNQGHGGLSVKHGHQGHHPQLRFQFPVQEQLQGVQLHLEVYQMQTGWTRTGKLVKKDLCHVSICHEIQQE